MAELMNQATMTKRAASEYDDYLSPKEEPSTPPPTTPKKAKKSPSTPSTTGSRSKNDSPGNGMPGSLAKTARGRYMELIFEAGLKAINKKTVQDEVSDLASVADIRLACLPLSRMKW